MTYKFELACNRMEWLDPFYKQVWQKAFDDAIPISGTFELTPRCNFNCKMCYVHLLEKDIPKYGKELSAKKWIDIAKQAKEAGTTWLCITGGEPLLHPEFEEIYTQLSKMGFFITLQTNASLIPKYQKLFENYPPRSIKITLYGSNNETYKKVCQIDNGFTKVHQSIQLLKKMNIPIQLVSTITKQNLDDIKKMAFYAYINQLPWTSTGGIKNSFRNEKINLDEIIVQDKIDQYKKEEIKHHLNNPINIERKPCTYCQDYRLGYWITWDGKMRFCSFLTEPNISIETLSFKEAWEQLIEYEDNLDWPQECKTCKVSSVCFKCAATLATHSGSVNKINNEYCQKIKRYYKEIKEE